MVSVAAVIVSHNSRPEIGRALRSVAHLDQVIVVDNGSQDGTQKLVLETFPQVQLLALKENLGFGRAINLGARLATTDFLLLLNPDAWLIDKDLSAWLSCLERHGASALGPGQEDEQGFFQLSFGLRPTLAKEALRRWAQRWLDAGGGRASWMAGLLKTMWRQAGPIPWVAGSAILVRHHDFCAIGGFDPSFFLFFEDIDLCLRLWHSGRKVIFAPQLRVGHSRGRSAARRPSLAQRAYRESQRYCADTHLDGLDAAIIRRWAQFRQGRVA